MLRFKKIIFFIIFVLLFSIIISFTFENFCFALGEPKLISKISTPAAAVAVGTGVFMKKFSFGDEDKIRTGKKIIKGSLFSYAFILAIDLILSAIKSLIG